MAPKGAKRSDGKDAKGSKGAATAQQSQLEFGLPATLVTALQSITSRSTQDLWKPNLGVEGDVTAEQRAQRRANAVRVLSKRINGDVKAKTDLEEALNLWLVQIAGHLQGLAQRVRAISAKLDEDLLAAIQEMGVSQEAQASLATTDQIAQAHAALGLVWKQPQENEVLKAAALLRAIGTVVVPSVAGAMGPQATAISNVELGATAQTITWPATVGMHPSGELPHAAAPAEGSEMSFGGGPGFPGAAGSESPGSLPGSGTQAPRSPGGEMAATARNTRWRKRGGSTVNRPSKSPRRDAEPPWPRSATGLTPEMQRRTPHSGIQEHNEAEPVPLTWNSAWMQVASYMFLNGAAYIGELARDPQQDAVLPLVDQVTDRQDLLEKAEILWGELSGFQAARDPAAIPILVRHLREVLNHARQCPSAVPGLRQGTLALAQATLGNLLDPFNFAPETAQEWLFPSALIEQPALIRGHVAVEPGDSEVIRLLLGPGCPSSWDDAGDGIAELT